MTLAGHPALLAIALGLTVVLAGCPGFGRRDTAGPTSVPTQASQEPSGHHPTATRADRFTVQSGSTPSATGCRIETTRFRPRHPRTQVPVILAHGFLRDQRRMAGLAQALAETGIPALTLNLCNSRPWNGRHVQNGLDMIAVARDLGATQVVYGGFSAGALAALVAGRLDPHALGVLVLDLVDTQGIGVGMARALNKPLIGLAGDPAGCNARNNGRAVFAVSLKGHVTAIPGASHCDFESPTDWLCESLCGDLDGGAAARRRMIIETSITAVTDLIGLTAPALAPSPTAPAPHLAARGPSYPARPPTLTD